jgi:phospholipase D1/2
MAAGRLLNISNRSMGVDTECDVVVEAQGEERVREAIRGARDRLLAEHAGVEVPVLQKALATHGSMAAAVAELGSPERSSSSSRRPRSRPPS